MRIIVTILILGFVRLGFSKDDNLEILKQNVQHWINLKAEISNATSEWASQKAILERELSIVELERSELETELQTVSKQQENVGNEIDMLITQKAELEKAINGLKPVLDKAEKDILELKKYIPAPLYTSVKKDFESIAVIKNKNDLISRLRTLVSLYLKIETMEHETHILREIFSIKGNQKVEMQVLYIGLGQAYAVSSDGNNALVGKPSADGWTWVNSPNIASEIQNAILIYSRERSPTIVNLPANVKEEAK
ncbi:MAG: DUF3450 family protein [Kiritimatiellae bacterium]|jgi:hypothetical protein|nr:DUF3450 family protein [Kiritimatiellia bacterium]